MKLFRTALLTFSLIAAPSFAAEYLPVHPKEPGAAIFERGGLGDDQSWAKARVEKSDAEDWCGNWQPGSPLADCAADVMENQNGKVFEARADCRSGNLTSVDGVDYLYDGIWETGDMWHGYSRWKDAKTGKIIGTDNADGGITLSAQWSELCPYGAPLAKQPLKAVLGEDDFSGIGDIWDHNGSVIYMDPRMGIISYRTPKKSIATTTAENQVLFRGTIHPDGPIHGMAYTFKKGCEPAPYLVDGYRSSGDLKIVLTGAAPKRDGCKVVGYTKDSPNAKLTFKILSD